MCIRDSHSPELGANRPKAPSGWTCPRRPTPQRCSGFPHRDSPFRLALIHPETDPAADPDPSLLLPALLLPALLLLRLFRLYSSLVGQSISRQITQGFFLGVRTLMRGVLHSGQASCRATLSPRPGSGYVCSHSGYPLQPTKRLPFLLRITRRSFSPQVGHGPNMLSSVMPSHILLATCSWFSSRDP